MNTSKKIIIIAGPTCSGKSTLAVELAANKGVIINADSIQLYHNLSILTARPSEQLMAHVPHKLFGILQGDERCSVAHWRTMALQEISHAFEQQLQPYIVGGTGLYLKGLIDGISEVPSIPHALRDQIGKQLQENGLEALYQALLHEDPFMAKKVHPHDQQRIIRALEVIRATGMSIAEWHKKKQVSETDYQYVKILILPDRRELNSLADQRLDHMVAVGALQEVKDLLHRNYPDTAPILKAIGVRELSAFLQNQITLEEAVQKAKHATHQYIKRQYTWFRHQFKADHVLSHPYNHNALEVIDWLKARSCLAIK